jgi:hypothetical protein
LATYEELSDLLTDPSLIKKVITAAGVAAESIRTEDPSTTNHSSRANLVYRQPEPEARRMLWSIITANKDLTAAQITGASDSAIQAQVDSRINDFADTIG